VTSHSQRCVVVGAGRAGRALALALRSVGWHVDVIEARPLFDEEPGVAISDLTAAADTADLVLLTVTDAVIDSVAAIIPPIGGVVAHVSGATTLAPLGRHRRTASMHPLMSLPNDHIGSERLLGGGTFAITGDPFIAEVVDSLGGVSIEVPDEQRAAYHAAASIASNHLVVLCGQVERLAEQIGVPADAYWAMMRSAVDNVAESGAAAALTGPAARGDWPTVRRHLAALPDDAERHLYMACCTAAARLADQQIPSDLQGR